MSRHPWDPGNPEQCPACGNLLRWSPWVDGGDALECPYCDEPLQDTDDAANDLSSTPMVSGETPERGNGIPIETGEEDFTLQNNHNKQETQTTKYYEPSTTIQD